MQVNDGSWNQSVIGWTMGFSCIFTIKDWGWTWFTVMVYSIYQKWGHLVRSCSCRENLHRKLVKFLVNSPLFQELQGKPQCACTNTHTHISIYISIYLEIYIYVRMYACTHVRMYACTYVRMYVCTYVRMYVCTYVRMYVCTYVRMYLSIYLCMY